MNHSTNDPARHQAGTGPDRHSGVDGGGAGSGEHLVWYAAYGSNLSAARFATYLAGGLAPHRHTDSPQQGSRDPSPARDNRPWPLPHRLFFTGSSASWGGGAVAMLDPQADAAPDQLTRGRIWLVTAEQFEDVFRQENGRAVKPGGSPSFSLSDLAVGGQIDVFNSWYGRVLCLGVGPGGHRIMTFAGADPDRLPMGAAHESYLRTIGLGLIESWHLTPRAAAEYLAQRDGNHGAISVEALIEDLANWSERS